MRGALAVCFAALAATVGFNVLKPAPRATKPVAPVVAVTALPPPVRIVIGRDRTASDAFSRTTARIEDFAPLSHRLLASGGELAFGLVQDDSNRPFLRVYVPPPPEPPTFAPPADGNVFRNAQARGREDEAKKGYAIRRRAWEEDASTRLETFMTDVEPLLEMPADAPRTDVGSFIARADLLLAEPSPFARSAATSSSLATVSIT